jgi:accessory gene regulator protein AgrB
VVIGKNAMHSCPFFATVIGMKWFWVIVLVIIGIIAALVAAEYLTVSIHAVPTWMGRHHGRGHYRKRGAAAVLVAIIAFVGAGYLFFRIRGADKRALAASAPAPVPADTVATAEVAQAPAPTELPAPAAQPAPTDQPTAE